MLPSPLLQPKDISTLPQYDQKDAYFVTKLPATRKRDPCLLHIEESESSKKFCTKFDEQTRVEEILYK